MLGARLGHFLDKPLAPLARRVTVSPNTLTLVGFFITAAAAGILPSHPRAGGFIILLGGFFDMLDGIVARNNGKKSVFGAFLDSTLDRYSDSLIFLAIAWYFLENGNPPAALLTVGSLVGALLISYTRARAEGLGLQCHVGLMERPERVVLLAAGCITGWLFPVVVVLFFFSHLTALQRMLYVFRQTR